MKPMTDDWATLAAKAALPEAEFMRIAPTTHVADALIIRQTAIERVARALRAARKGSASVALPEPANDSRAKSARSRGIVAGPEPSGSGGSARFHYQHYYSTYCIHNDHEYCRLTCKTCKAPCLCECHKATGEAGGKK